VIATRLPLVEAAPGAPLPPLPRSAWLAIDLDALVSNYRLLAGCLPPGIRLEAVVKGDAYGHGAVPVARALEAAGVQSMSVATFDEGLELRQAGISVPILVLFPCPPELAADALRLGLSLTAGDRTLLERTLAVLRRLPPAAAGDTGRLPIHVEVETGLGRGGFQANEIPAAVAAIEAEPRACLAGLWSHLQDAGDAARTAAQAARFGIASSLLDQIECALPGRHLAASGGLLAASAPSYDVVRIGLALYGIVPDGLAVDERHRVAAAGLQPIMALRAQPVRVAWLEAGTGVSYGPSFVTQRDSLVATIPVGYADGYPRSLSNRAQALVRGKRVPVIGTVAMDAVMVDVTDVPDPPVSVDDEFTLLGQQGADAIEALEVARWGNTISYEVVTAMSSRLARVYYAAAKAVEQRTIATELTQGGGEEAGDRRRRRRS
jgi:alanine racemase